MPVYTRFRKIFWAPVHIVLSLLKRISLPFAEDMTLYDLLKAFFVGLTKGMFTYRSGAISFSFFMAIFPFLLFVLNLIPYIPIDNFQEDFLNFLETLLPPQTSDTFLDIFNDISKNRRAGLLSSVGFFSIFLMSNGINAIFGSFENSYHVQLTRGFIKQYAISVGVALMMAIAMLITVAVFTYSQIYIFPQVGHLVSKLTSYNIFIIEIIEISMMIVFAYFFVSILYYFGVRHEHKKRFFTIGGLFTTILMALATWLFSIYVTHFSRYNELYGSIGALLILMLYIWLNCNLLLLGFELNASISTFKKSGGKNDRAAPIN